jgi:hypothetical protein
MKRRTVAAFASALMLSLSIAATAAGQGNVPDAQPQGCHGAATLAYKQSVGSPSQADGILAQAHSEIGRGETLQQFLAAECSVGRYAD